MKLASLVCVSLTLLAAILLLGQEPGNAPGQSFTLYPPSVYMHEFHPCSSDKRCEKTEEFQVDPVPNGCCVLVVTNGNGRGKDEVRHYEVVLNGERVIPDRESRNAQATVKISLRNTLKVALTGDQSSRVFILVTYDPRQK
jgi:hypothetical protein